MTPSRPMPKSRRDASGHAPQAGENKSSLASPHLQVRAAAYGMRAASVLLDRAHPQTGGKEGGARIKAALRLSRSALECGSEAAALEFRQKGGSFAAALQAHELPYR